MIYDKDIPDFALRPAKDPEREGDGFDPSPYDRILSIRQADEEEMFEFAKEPDLPEMEEPGLAQMKTQAQEREERKECEECEAAIEPESHKPTEPESMEHEPAGLEIADSEPEAESYEPEAETYEPGTYEIPGPAMPEFKAPGPEPDQKSALAEQPLINMPQHRKEPAKIVPLTGSVINSNLKITDIKEPPKTKIFIEEDILVPDVKPDLRSILSMDGVAKLSGKEIQVGANGEDKLKVTGEIALQTIYIPDNVEEGQEQIITIQSRVSFKTDWGVSVSPLSHVAVTPIIENVDYTVINERKFRAKITMFLTLREYSDMDVEIFEGIKGEDVQLLKEKIELTDVAVRKTDVIDIDENLALKDSAPIPEKILKYNINIVENHKQIAGEKVVINATIYCNVLYLADQDIPNGENPGAEAPDTLETGIRRRKEPYIFQGKTEFTQFIPFSNGEPPTGSRITFNGSDLTLKIREGDELQTAFHLEGNVETSLELYKNVEKEIVTDLYHNEKDITYDFTEIKTMALCGSNVSEVSVREIVNVPEKYDEAEKVIYITGRIKDNLSTIEQSKNIVEGVAEITLLCISSNEKRTPFKMTQEISFRCSMEIPGIKQGMTADNEIAIKDLWFDRINPKQIEVNAGVFISSSVSSQESHKLIRNVCFVEKTENMERMPSMIVCIAKKGDNLWKIAKKYRTTVDTIKSINNMEGSEQISPGTKLLIVK